MKKKILFVINTMGRAGAERVLISLLRTLDKEKFDIDFLSIINRGELFTEIPAYVNILNDSFEAKSVMDIEAKAYLIKRILKILIKKCYFIKYIPYALKNLFFQLKSGRLQFDKLFWLALAENTPVTNKEYDLAIGFTEGAATYYVSNRVTAKKKAVFVHINYIKAGYMPSLDRHFYEKSDAIFSVSTPVMNNFNSAYPEFVDKSSVFQNIVIPDDIKAKAKDGKGFDDGFTGIRILTVARLHPQKALDIAIPAFAALVALGYDNVRWYILGEGAERPTLEKLIARYNMQDKFILQGAEPNPYPFFDQCDIYVQASRFEGWCIAIAEALLLNKPTLVTDCAVNDSQVIDGETGLITELTQEKLTYALKRLVDDEKLRAYFSKNLETRSTDYARDLHKLYSLVGLPYTPNPS